MAPRSWNRVAREFSIHCNILDEIKWAILKWEGYYNFKLACSFPLPFTVITREVLHY